MANNKNTVKNRLINPLEDAFGRTKTMNSHCLFGSQFTVMLAINKLSVSIYLSMLRTKTNLVRGNFGQPANTDRFQWESDIQDNSDV